MGATATATTPETATPGRAWAYGGFVFGIAASVAANIESKRAAATATDDIDIGPIVAAATWPVALVVATEVLLRVSWPSGNWWRVARFGAVAAVALVAATISYGHLRDLLLIYGESELAATIGPFAVDGLMVVCSLALMATARQRHAAAMPAVAPAPSAATSPLFPDPARTSLPLKTATSATAPRKLSPETATKVAAALRPQGEVVAPAATQQTLLAQPARRGRGAKQAEQELAALELWHKGERDLKVIADTVGTGKWNVERWTKHLRQPAAVATTDPAATTA